MTYDIGQVIELNTGKLIILSTLRPGSYGLDVHDVLFMYYGTDMTVEMDVEQITRLINMTSQDYLV